MVFNKRLHAFSSQKKSLAFICAVPLLLATAFVYVPCPVCHGVGTISSYGMEHITLVDSPVIVSMPQPQKIYCGSWLEYRVEVIITLQNHGDQDVAGFVMLQLTDPISGYSSELCGVAIFASAGKISPQQVTTPIQMPVSESFAKPIVLASVPEDITTCKECNGAGKVVLNAWFLSKKRFELNDKRFSFGERFPDVPHEESKEDWIWVPSLDINYKPILDDSGFPILEQVEDFGGTWVIALDDYGNPILDGNSQIILIYVLFWT